MAGTVVTAATNNINIVNGTASLDVAAASAVDVNANLTVSSATILSGTPLKAGDALGTPASGVLTNCTGYAVAATEAVVGVAELATNAEALAGSDNTRIVTPDDLKYVLDRRIQQFYGVSWDESADTYVRTGATAGQAVGVTLADAFLPIQSRMRGCLLNDDGTVNYYLSATDWTKKEDGATSSVLTGADGQVMVQIPKFWYRYGYAGTTHTSEISPVPLAGFEPHPAFFKDGAWVDHRYMGAYEGVLYDTSGASYISKFAPVAAHNATFDVDNGSSKGTITAASGTPYTLLLTGYMIVITGTADNNGTYVIDSVTGGNVITCTTVIAGADGAEAATAISSVAVDWTATTGDKLSSVAGKLAVSNGTRAQLRTIAANRGTGWRQQDYDLTAAVQLLMLTEYASFYTQSVIGAGITNVVDWAAYNSYYPIGPSGLGNAIGNATGTNAAAASTAAATVAATGYLKYRGIENPYGHLWKFVEGINVNGNIPYRTNVGANFADDTVSNYTRMVDINGAGVTLYNGDGYVATIQKMKWGFLAASVGASGSTKITDYYYQASGWGVVLVGGNADNGAHAGAFFVDANFASGNATSYLAGRVCF